MADTVVVLSERDAVTLKSFLDRLRRDTEKVSTSRDFKDDSDYLPPEVYLAKAPSGGVPALTSSVLGYADCDIYRSFTTGAVEATGYTKTVYNHTGTAIAAGTLFPVARGKFGTWHALPPAPSATATAAVFSGASAPSGPPISQTVSSLVNTSLISNSVLYDTGGYWQGVGTSGFKPSSNGYYLVGLSGVWTYAAGGGCRRILLSGGADNVLSGLCSSPVSDAIAPSSGGRQSITQLFRANSGQVISASLYQDSGAALNWFTHSFWIIKMGSF